MNSGPNQDAGLRYGRTDFAEQDVEGGTNGSPMKLRQPPMIAIARISPEN